MRFWPWTNKSAQPQAPENYDQYTAYSQLLDRNGTWIEVADTKAGVILGFLVATFPVLVSPALSRVQMLINAIPSHATIWAYSPLVGFLALVVLFLITAFVTLLSVILTLAPRLSHHGQPGLIFFGDIATQEYRQWQQRLLSLDAQQLALQVLEQVYVTASIAHHKHKHVGQAIRALIATVFLGILLYLLSQIFL